MLLAIFFSVKFWPCVSCQMPQLCYAPAAILLRIFGKSHKTLKLYNCTHIYIRDTMVLTLLKLPGISLSQHMALRRYCNVYIFITFQWYIEYIYLNACWLNGFACTGYGILIYEYWNVYLHQTDCSNVLYVSNM